MEFIIMALIALAAVIVGPVIALKVARRQIRAQVVSVNRQAWINTLRDEFSVFVGALGMMSVIVKHKGSGLAKEDYKLFQCLLTLRTKIELLGNPNESDHVRLVEILDKAINASCKTESDDDKKVMDGYVDEAVQLCQSILKREWNRVKSGK